MTPSARSLVEGVRDALVARAEAWTPAGFVHRGKPFEQGDKSYIAALTTALSQPRFTPEEREAIDAATEWFFGTPDPEEATYDKQDRLRAILEGMLDTRERKGGTDG